MRRECLTNGVEGKFPVKVTAGQRLIKLAIPGERIEPNGVGGVNYEMDFFLEG
jgi:hypothetical protein